ncbi:MAG: DNA topoisomerase IV subunit A [Proteobacteria bacterium]|nr:DNA topoisomerase IV subunit A [Pseudomonadota bacterium]
MTEASAIGEIRPTPLTEALSERYLTYALSTIMTRSLPDVRDGLKPVHRRLLHAMRQLRLDPGAGFKKCARVVGDVIGKYHPHGDAAVYDALVRLAQDFAVRYPLVDGQGNFGNIDGDNAAAMRYTEARLTEVAGALLEGIDEDAVDFRPTYDGEDEEPIVLPANFPNLLANGVTGIAVGMATSIPPHNAGEICDALRHLIKHPKATVAKLVEFMPGPDFPTGGVLVEPRANIIEAYRGGRGSFRLRARWHTEDLGRGQYRIVVTEIPYQVHKARLVEKIAELLAVRKLAMLADVRDESAAELRVVLEPKSRTVEPAMLMESLFRQTELETRISLNMNVLDAGQTPRVMALDEVLRAFLDHRHAVLVRRTRHRLARIERRLEILSGYIIAFANLDEVIAIIRKEDAPKGVLMKRWGLTEVQADSILNMRLRTLRRLEEVAIGKELKEIEVERAALKKLLADEGKRWRAVADEIKAVKRRFGPDTELGRRRTELGGPPPEVVIPLEAMVEREPATVICSEKGWIRALKGHLDESSDPSDKVKYKEGDKARFLIRAETTDKLVIFATNGRCYTIGVDKLPRGRGQGEPLRLMIDLPNDHEAVAMFVHRPGSKLLVAASDGRGLVVAEDEIIAQTRSGKQVLNVSGDVEAQVCVPAEGDAVAVLGENRKLLIFKLAEVPRRSRGRGVILQRYAKGGLADARVFTLSEGLATRSGERTRTFTELGPWIGRRANAGRLPPSGFPRSNRFN